MSISKRLHSGRSQTHFRARRGFTLVELLVVIAIIGILVALLLPAVQAGREAGRRLHCANNLKQLGLGAQVHHDAHRYFPSGGWGWTWTGDADKGFGKRQSGGWHFSMLPFIEQDNLHAMGKGRPGLVRRAEGKKREEIAVATFICPSRRSVRAYPYGHGLGNIEPPTVVCRSDYAANAGDGRPVVAGGKCYVGDTPYGDGNLSECSGVVFQYSEVSIADIRDGTTYTLFCGERNLDPDHYETGTAGDNDQSAYVGHDRDVLRFGSSSSLPVQDTPGAGQHFSFGGAHPGIFQAALCDGSIRNIALTIDSTTIQRLCHRKDDQVFENSSW